MNKKLPQIPKDGLAGLKENFSADAVSGFIVFLLALPLSLGIAKASDFPPLMGLVSAIIGGLLVSCFMGSRLSIKGPAAGLIVVVVGAVNAFGGAELGWHLALGAMLVSGILQILFGLFKLGKLTDFFPLSTIHGMLAAIGIVIIVKQLPILMNVDPLLTKGKSFFSLIAQLPSLAKASDPKATLIGLVCLLVMLYWHKVPTAFLKKIPAALIVLIFAVPMAMVLDFRHTEPIYSLVHIGQLSNSIKINVQFAAMTQIGTFIKYVIMLALVGSIESLLTLKAIDMADPYQRKSNSNKDLVAIGIGNTLSAILGGLPMISEVARSTSNVNNGAQTRWANFFHGLFMLLFVLFAAQFIELIPNTALAAMLISVGIKLAHPKIFVHIFNIGKEQLAIFICTIFFTLYEDLLVGIAAGILLKIIIHMLNGAALSTLFKAPVSVSFNEHNYLIEVDKSAVFSNYLGIKSKLEAIPAGMNIILDFSKTKLVDHSVMENLQQFEHHYALNGGVLTIVGLEQHVSLSTHIHAARKKK